MRLLTFLFLPTEIQEIVDGKEKMRTITVTAWWLTALFSSMFIHSASAIITTYDDQLKPINMEENSPKAVEARRNLVRDCSSVIVPPCAEQGTRDVVSDCFLWSFEGGKKTNMSLDII